MTWNTVVSIIILIGLGLGFWAKMTNQTIPEIIGGIIDRVRDTSEELVEDTIEMPY